MGRAVTWVHLRSGGSMMAEQVPYLAGPLFGWARQKRRGQKLATMLEHYRRAYGDFELTIVGHSNGGGIGRLAITQSDVPAKHVHLLSPATPADFNTNGLREEMERGGIEHLTIWRGGQDWPLSFGRAWFKGQKVLGKVGPKGIGEPVHTERRVETVGLRPLVIVTRSYAVGQGIVHDTYIPEFGHNSWFREDGTLDWMLSNVSGLPITIDHPIASPPLGRP